MSVNIKLLAGSCLSYVYNDWVGKIPSRTMRKAFLRAYLGCMGGGSAVQMHCRFLNGRKIFLGKRNIINFGCLLDGRKFEISTGDDVAIGPEATILTLGHDPQSPTFAPTGGRVLIGAHVWIAYRATILPGVEIGDGAVVGACAVVTKDVPPYAIVAGNPARIIGERSRHLAYQSSFAPFLQ
jgi:acetyltransferase-like isoleucine patch superfamily enzyme